MSCHQTKVCNFHWTGSKLIWFYQKVFWFDVPMENSKWVTILKSIKQGTDNLTSLFFFEVFLFYNLIEKFSPFHKLSYKAYEPIAFVHVVQLYDVWVVNLSQKFHLIIDLKYLIIGHTILWDDFDSKFLFSLSVFAFFDDRCLPWAYSFLNFIGFSDIFLCEHCLFILKI